MNVKNVQCYLIINFFCLWLPNFHILIPLKHTSIHKFPMITVIHLLIPLLSHIYISKIPFTSCPPPYLSCQHPQTHPAKYPLELCLIGQIHSNQEGLQHTQKRDKMLMPLAVFLDVRVVCGSQDSTFNFVTYYFHCNNAVWQNWSSIQIICDKTMTNYTNIRHHLRFIRSLNLRE